MNGQVIELQLVEGALREFFAAVRREEDAPPSLWPRVTSRIHALEAELVQGAGSEQAARPPAGNAWHKGGQLLHRPWRNAAAILASLALLMLLVLVLPGGQTGVVSAQEVLRKAQTTALSPQAAGIESLVVVQTYETYSLSQASDGIVTSQEHYRIWYQTPNRQRIEIDYGKLAADGTVQPAGTSVSVWDGINYWTYDSMRATVRILRQDPNADTYLQGVLRGAPPGSLDALYASSCRSARITGQGNVVGRAAHILELGPPQCGWALPGSDGRAMVWVDQATGFVLKTEMYAADGRLFAVREVRSVEFNGSIAPERFRFVTPSGAEVRDDREQPIGVGVAYAQVPPKPISLDEARDLATFEVQAPRTVPSGFALASVEHYWGNDKAKELRSHADWVLLRYMDANGNWFVITQGFGGYVPGLVLGAPAEARQGTVDVNGHAARWVEGNPSDGWRRGGMTLLAWEHGRQGTGWEISPGGESLTGSPFYFGLASNALTVNELLAIAESLDGATSP